MRVLLLVRDAVELCMWEGDVRVRVHLRDGQVIARGKAEDLVPDDHSFTFSKLWATKFLEDMKSYRRSTRSKKNQPGRLEGTPKGEEARTAYLVRREYN